MGSKAARQVPDVLLEWLNKNVSPEFSQWYAKNSRLGARQITTERQRMSADAGTVGAYHEGHFRGAKDVDPKMGGGPTTGLTMRPEIGVVNVAHKEAPRIPYEDMRRAGIPQNWIEDVFESVLHSEGLGVIGNFDTQAAMDMDAGMDPGQAMAQTDRRQQLRQQGVKQVGPDTSVILRPFEGEIKVKPDAELPNLTKGLQQQLEREQKQIAARRSTKAKAKPEPEVLKQMRIKNMRKMAGTAAAAGLAGVSILGTGASAAETKTRKDIATETGDLADKIQAGISGVSLAADIASYTPIGAIPGTIVSTGADLINIIIDQFRQGATHQRIRGRSGAKRALSGSPTTGL